MSPRSTAFAVSQLRHMISRAPAPIVHGGATVNGVTGTLTASTLQASVGLQAKYVESVWTVLADWTDAGVAAPAAEDAITVNGADRRVLRAVTLPCGVTMRLDLGAKYE